MPAGDADSPLHSQPSHHGSGSKAPPPSTLQHLLAATEQAEGKLLHAPTHGQLEPPAGHSTPFLGAHTASTATGQKEVASGHLARVRRRAASTPPGAQIGVKVGGQQEVDEQEDASQPPPQECLLVAAPDPSLSPAPHAAQVIGAHTVVKAGSIQHPGAAEGEAAAGPVQGSNGEGCSGADTEARQAGNSSRQDDWIQAALSDNADQVSDLSGMPTHGSLPPTLSAPLVALPLAQPPASPLAQPSAQPRASKVAPRMVLGSSESEIAPAIVRKKSVGVVRGSSPSASAATDTVGPDQAAEGPPLALKGPPPLTVHCAGRPSGATPSLRAPSAVPPAPSHSAPPAAPPPSTLPALPAALPAAASAPSFTARPSRFSASRASGGSGPASGPASSGRGKSNGKVPVSSEGEAGSGVSSTAEPIAEAGAGARAGAGAGAVVGAGAGEGEGEGAGVGAGAGAAVGAEAGTEVMPDFTPDDAAKGECWPRMISEVGLGSGSGCL